MTKVDDVTLGTWIVGTEGERRCQGNRSHENEMSNNSPTSTTAYSRGLPMSGPHYAISRISMEFDQTQWEEGEQ